MSFCQTRVLVCPKVLPPDCGGKESGEHKDQTRATVYTAACQHGQSCDTKSVDATTLPSRAELREARDLVSWDGTGGTGQRDWGHP